MLLAKDEVQDSPKGSTAGNATRTIIYRYGPVDPGLREIIEVGEDQRTQRCVPLHRVIGKCKLVESCMIRNSHFRSNFGYHLD